MLLDAADNRHWKATLAVTMVPRHGGKPDRRLPKTVSPTKVAAGLRSHSGWWRALLSSMVRSTTVGMRTTLSSAVCDNSTFRLDFATLQSRDGCVSCGLEGLMVRRGRLGYPNSAYCPMSILKPNQPFDTCLAGSQTPPNWPSLACKSQSKRW